MKQIVGLFLFILSFASSVAFSYKVDVAITNQSSQPWYANITDHKCIVTASGINSAHLSAGATKTLSAHVRTLGDFCANATSSFIVNFYNFVDSKKNKIGSVKIHQLTAGDNSFKIGTIKPATAGFYISYKGTYCSGKHLTCKFTIQDFPKSE